MEKKEKQEEKRKIQEERKRVKEEKKRSEEERRKTKAESPEEIQKPQEKGQEKILDSLVGTIERVGEALDEDVAEMGEGETEESPSFDPGVPTVKKRRTLFAVGLLVIVMAVVGVISTVNFAISVASDIANKTALKKELARFIYPLVITDVPGFDSVEAVPESVVITSAIWNIILNGDTGKYEQDGLNMYVSEIDVESSAASLYGYGVPIKHQSVNIGTVTFQYDETNRSYAVPVSTETNGYSPVVEEVSNVGELYTVTVAYMPPSYMYMEGMDYEVEPDKTMIYVISRTGTGSTVQSVTYGNTTTNSPF